MDNGSINTGSAGTLALLADTARAGRGYWGGEGSYGGYGPYASPSANAVRANRNFDQQKFVYDALSQQAEETRRILQSQNASGQVADGFNRLCDRLNQVDGRSNDQFFQSELRQTDRLAAMTAQMNDFRAEAAKCCCDTNLRIAEVEARLASRMEQLDKENVLRELNRAERKLETQTILSSCGCGCGGGVRPCPPPFPPA